MKHIIRRVLGLCLLVFAGAAAQAAPPPRPLPGLSPADAEAAAADYQRYCALCHGADRAGHANDHAPSLRSQSLLRTAVPWLMREAIAYGRPGTPMGAYLDEVGGPLSLPEVQRLVLWLYLEGGAPERVRLDPTPVQAHPVAGARLYQTQCAECHGADGEGGTGTALANPAMLATTPDAFLQHAITHGRDGTPMPAFGERLSGHEIAGITAYIRSFSTGGLAEPPAPVEPPALADAVLNPDGEAPRFEFSNGHYILAADLDRALREKRRLVLLDTRVPSMWQIGHIAGAVPLPYYTDDVALFEALPRDGTWIVTYCECPRAAADSVNRMLREQGFENTAVLWEGIGGWVALGYPTVTGQVAQAQ